MYNLRVRLVAVFFAVAGFGCQSRLSVSTSDKDGNPAGAGTKPSSLPSPDPTSAPVTVEPTQEPVTDVTPSPTPTPNPTISPSPTPSTTPVPSPDPTYEDPRNVGASIGRNGEIRLIWEPPFFGRMPAEYVIYRSLNSNVDKTATPLAVVSGNEYVDTSAVNGTTYYYAVVGRAASGEVSSGVTVAGMALAPAAARMSSLLFVNPAAAGGGDGSIGNPYNDIATAITDVDAGGTVVLLPGIFRISTSLAANKAITLRSQQGAYETVGGSTIRGPNSFETGSWTSSFPAVVASADDVEVVGLNFTQFYITVPDNNAAAVIHHGAAPTPIRNLLIHNNRFFKNRANVTSSMSFGAADRDGQTGWVVSSNYVTDMPSDGNGIVAHYWKNCLIKDNIVVNSAFAGIQTLGIRECEITRNLIVNATEYGIKVGCLSGTGNCENISVTKNILVGTKATGYFGSVRLSHFVLGTLTFSHNIIQNSLKSAAYFDGGGNLDGFTFNFKNNHFENSTAFGLLNTTSTGTIDATENWWGSAAGAGVGGDPDSETIAPGSATVNTNSHLTSRPNSRFPPGKVLVSVAVSPWTTKTRGESVLTATGTFSDASTMDVSAYATWVSSDSDTVTVSDIGSTKGRATALKTGTATISAIVDGKIGSTSVVVSAARIIAQNDGNSQGWRWADPSTGALSALVTPPTIGSRGVLTLPTGFLALNYGAAEKVKFFDYSGVASTTLQLTGYTYNTPHGGFLSKDNVIFISDMSGSPTIVRMHRLSDGVGLGSFTAEGAGAWFTYNVTELDDGRLIAGSSDGRIIAYNRSGATVTKIGDLATGLTNVYSLDYCPKQNRIIAVALTDQVWKCTTAGVCNLIYTYTDIGDILGVRRDINAGDCSMFVTVDNGRILKLAADGSVINGFANPFSMFGTGQTYGLDFEWPAP